MILRIVLHSKAIFKGKMLLNFVYSNLPTMLRKEQPLFLLLILNKRVVVLQVHLLKKEVKENLEEVHPNLQDLHQVLFSWMMEFFKAKYWTVQMLGLLNFTLLEYILAYLVRTLQKLWTLIQQIARNHRQKSSYSSYWWQQAPAIYGKVSS